MFAGDAADAFDTILHKGQLGQIYNVGSYDEISNIDLCGKLLTLMKIPHDSPELFRKWIKYTHDRPFNDRRYAVDATKLRELGWEQKTSLEEGLKTTVDWYSRFGETWWGDISHVLTPFPVVNDEGELMPDDEHSMRDEPLQPGEVWDENQKQNERANGESNGHENGEKNGHVNGDKDGCANENNKGLDNGAKTGGYRGVVV